jgi:hypothetical protein
MSISSIIEFPVFESSQFQFISTHPITSELVAMTNEAGYQKKLLNTKPDNWSREMIFTRTLHNNPRYSPVISTEAIDKYGHKEATNAFRYLCIFIKQVKIRPVDHVAIMLWFVEQGIVDIDKTIQTYNIKM